MLKQRMPAPLSGIHSEMDQFFNGMLTPFRGWSLPSMSASTRTVPLNLWEDAEAVHVEAEIPGIKLEDLEILVSGSQLTIRGRRPSPADGVENWHRRERLEGEFSRVIELSATIEADQVKARLENGVLDIDLPKAQESRPRKVEVKQIG